ncbi:hypothetical protein R70723_25110 [Paenibacillus sp. FSL R7-0273]|uniref:hypothetical protein n=1 Tax=Paenibacillus sp. FSL R7-0273 TaxID=1536772 RepID=UPI0004F90B30|nr:hypothetical protein [Paenibacillus sp. FSL R7-0273]AIQ48820.1 hypothetical protein R70723_25110 [Paenibacillus sp. FSL R7-0273]OMF93844.1 hypothetical protein BK144_09515 [Paenibacillus sp. FSL R7-0273]
MSRFGKKLVMIGVYAGIGILIGIQFSGSGAARTEAVAPGWNGPAGLQQAGQAAAAAGTGAVQGSPAYVYVPMAVDPATGAYTALPAFQPQSPAQTPADSSGLPQQEVQDYSVLTPEQLLIPEEQQPGIDRLADKTAGLLQQASQKSIRWIVSLFDSAD